MFDSRRQIYISFCLKTLSILPCLHEVGAVESLPCVVCRQFGVPCFPWTEHARCVHRGLVFRLGPVRFQMLIQDVTLMLLVKVQ